MQIGSTITSNPVQCALAKLLRKIQLSAADRRLASALQQLVRERVSTTFRGVKRSFLSGSMGRHTAISPLHDIDVVLVLDHETRARLFDEAPERTIIALAGSVKSAFPCNRVKVQNRSIKIQIKGIDIDIVPAFQEEEDAPLIIPDRRASRWWETDPESVRDESPHLNGINEGLLKPVIKLLKHWRNIWEIPIKSFHLEMMIYQLERFKMPTIDTTLCEAFQHLGKSIHSTCPDPANCNIDLGEYLSQSDKNELARRFEAAIRESRGAVEATYYGNIQDAHKHWRKVFRQSYPD